jgi:hypothetical protein
MSRNETAVSDRIRDAQGKLAKTRLHSSLRLSPCST